MLISIDSGDPLQIQTVKDWEFPIDKITSNPTTISATINRIKQETGKDVSVYDVAMQIRDTVGKNVPVSVETIGASYPSYNPRDMNAETFVEEAHRIMEWDPHFVVKLPTVPQGLESANILHGEVPINFTLVFSQHQGHLAADYGGAYVSPFVGRIDDKLKDPSLIVEDNMPSDGMDLVEKIIHEYNEFDFSTMVLTASTRSEDHLKRAAECGSHLATIPFNLLKSIHDNHPDRGIELFAVLKKSRFHTPKNLSKPTYSSSFNWMKMKHFERELTINGVERFLADAQSAWYSIIDKD